MKRSIVALNSDITSDLIYHLDTVRFRGQQPPEKFMEFLHLYRLRVGQIEFRLTTRFVGIQAITYGLSLSMFPSSICHSLSDSALNCALTTFVFWISLSCLQAPESCSATSGFSLYRRTLPMLISCFVVSSESLSWCKLVQPHLSIPLHICHGSNTHLKTLSRNVATHFGSKFTNLYRSMANVRQERQICRWKIIFSYFCTFVAQM